MREDEREYRLVMKGRQRYDREEEEESGKAREQKGAKMGKREGINTQGVKGRDRWSEEEEGRSSYADEVYLEMTSSSLNPHP